MTFMRLLTWLMKLLYFKKNALEITEGGDSNDKEELVGIDSMPTPMTKSLDKRPADRINIWRCG